MGNRKILLLGLVTILLFPAVAFIIHYFFSVKPFLEIFTSHSNLAIELGVGMLTGTVGGLIGWGIISLPFMMVVREKYQGMIYSLRLNIATIILVSICAGVGEEILFRGVLQEYFGIWITSVAFVAIHGYLSPFDWRISLYGTFMVLLIALLGYYKMRLGLITAMTAHTFIDIVLFYFLSKKPLPKHLAGPFQPTD